MAVGNRPPPRRSFQHSVFNNAAQKLTDEQANIARQMTNEDTPFFFLSRTQDGTNVPISPDDAQAPQDKPLELFGEQKREEIMETIRNLLPGGHHQEHFINNIEQPADLTLLTSGIIARELRDRLDETEMQDLQFINFLGKTPDISHAGLEQINDWLADDINEYRDMTLIDDKPRQIEAIQNMSMPNKYVFQSTMIALLEAANQTRKAQPAVVIQFANDLIDITSTKKMDQELTLTTISLLNELSLTTSAGILVGMNRDGTVKYTRPPPSAPGNGMGARPTGLNT